MRFLIHLFLFFIVHQAHPETIYTVAIPDSDLYPHYHNSGGVSGGLLIETLKKFEKDKNYKFKIMSYSINRYIKLFLNKKIDFIMPANPSWRKSDKRGYAIKYSSPIFSSTTGFLVKKGKNNIKKNEIKQIATIKGYTLPFSFLNHNKTQVFALSSNESIIKMIDKGRVDAGYIHITYASNLYKPRNISSQLVTAKNLPQIESDYHIATILYPEIISDFDKWLKSNKDWLSERKLALGIK